MYYNVIEFSNDASSSAIQISFTWKGEPGKTRYHECSRDPYESWFNNSLMQLAQEMGDDLGPSAVCHHICELARCNGMRGTIDWLGLTLLAAQKSHVAETQTQRTLAERLGRYLEAFYQRQAYLCGLTSILK